MFLYNPAAEAAREAKRALWREKIDRLPLPGRLFLRLARHFFDRFFDGELSGADAETRLTAGHILALLAVPGLFFGAFLFPKYTHLSFRPPEVYQLTMWSDKMFLITFTMAVIGFITVLQWDTLFPDRLDFTVLVPLPLTLRSIFAAKIASLTALLVLFVVDVNIYSTIIFPFATLRWDDPLELALAFTAAHTASLLAAGAFVFFFFVCLQGLLLNLLSANAFRKISPLVQSFSMFVLLSSLFLFPKLSGMLGGLKRDGGSWLDLFPPLWFVGLSERWMGRPHAALEPLADRGLAAVWVALAGAALFYFISYRRYVGKSLETAGRVCVEPGPAWRLLRELKNRLVVPSPLQRAAFDFTARSMSRSGRHRLFLSAYAGVGFAFVLEVVAAMFSGPEGEARMDRPNAALLAVPLILSFFLLSGMRVIFTIPAELKCNWIFRLTENERRNECLAGVRRAMGVCAVAPLFTLLFPLHVFLWGWSTALWHTLFGVVLSLALIEFLLLGFRKIPFTCSYLPGKANLTGLWLAYCFGYSTYAYSMARLELAALESPAKMAVLILGAAVLLAGLAAWRNRQLHQGFRFVFEEELPAVFARLDLNGVGQASRVVES